MTKAKKSEVRRFKCTISTPINDKIYDELREIAIKEDVAVTVIVRRALNKFLKHDFDELFE